jgi:arylformamidase
VASPWIDVSVSLRDRMVTWPGDPEAHIGQVLSLERGDPCTVSLIEIGAHTGTHMDAPAHFVAGGAGIDSMPSDAAVGPARVIAIANPESVNVRELEPHQIQPGERILFKTRNSHRDWQAEPFAEDFVYVSADAARYLVERRVLLVGIDYLSVGGFRMDGVETHQALLNAGIWIIEGLYLNEVPAGPVELICLPLKIAGGDGAPARALVRRADG